MNRACRACRLRLGRAAGREVCKPAEFRSYTASAIKRLVRTHVRTSEDAAAVIAEISGVDYTEREHIIGIGLDSRNRIVSIADGSSGERSVCMYYAKDLIKALLDRVPRGNAVSGVILGHNHPGGDPTPSAEDVSSTSSFLDGFCGMQLIDHVIVAPVGKHTSMREHELVAFGRSC